MCLDLCKLQVMYGNRPISYTSHTQMGIESKIEYNY